MKKITLILAVFLCLGLKLTGLAEDRILWCSIGDGLTNTTNLQSQIDFAVANNYNAICILARYRADCFYIPNRDYKIYSNPEPRRSSTVDSIQYILDHGHEVGLKIYAAISCFLVTDGSGTYPSYLPADSVMWIYKGDTSDLVYSPLSGYPRAMTACSSGCDTDEGLWCDPGRNDIQIYTRNVVKDFVQNYDIDGIILDRIRYRGDGSPYRDASFGYNPQALIDMGLTNPAPGSTAFIQARRNAITKFISDLRADIHMMKPWIIYGAAPIVYGTSLSSTYNYVFQYFPDWNNGNNPDHISGKGILDMVCPQYYRTTAAANATVMTLVNNDIDETNNMYHEATLDAALEPAAEAAQSICDTRSKNMKGFGFFSYGYVNANSYMTTLNAATTSPCGTNVMGDKSTNVEYQLKKNWDSVAPNNITNLAGDNSVATKIKLTWTIPPAASDGDIPVRYLVYRSATTPVKLYYSNLVNRNYTVTGNTFTDDPSTGLSGGSFYYKVIPVDDYNNKGNSNQIGPISSNMPNDYIIESKSPGLNYTDYSEISGNWGDSTSKSTAPGLTANINSRYSTLATKNDVARFTPKGLSQGTNYFDIYYTTNIASSTNCANCTYRVMTSAGSLASGLFDVIPGTTGNKWYKIGKFLLSSSSAYIEVDNSSSTTSASDSYRLPADAVKFVYAPLTPTPSPTPSATPTPSPTPTPTPYVPLPELIIDSFETYASESAMDAVWKGSTGSTLGTLKTTGGASSTSKWIELADGGYAMNLYASFSNIVTTSRNYKCAFYYKNGHINNPQSTLKVLFKDGTDNVKATFDLGNTVQTDWGYMESSFVTYSSGDIIKIDITGNNSVTSTQNCAFDQFKLLYEPTPSPTPAVTKTPTPTPTTSPTPAPTLTPSPTPTPTTTPSPTPTVMPTPPAYKAGVKLF